METELQGWLGMAVFLGEIWPCFWLPNPLSRKGGGKGGAHGGEMQHFSSRSVGTRQKSVSCRNRLSSSASISDTYFPV